MPRTRTDLVVEVLDLLGVTQTGQEPSAEDAEKVDLKVNDLRDELAVDVLYIQDIDAIEERYFDAVARLLANRCASSFGSGWDDQTEERNRRRLISMQKSPRQRASVQRIEHF